MKIVYLVIGLLLCAPAYGKEEVDFKFGESNPPYWTDEQGKCVSSNCPDNVDMGENDLYVCGCVGCPPCNDKSVLWDCDPECGKPKEQVKSKRQEYIDKGDLFLEALPTFPITGSDLRNDALKHTTNADIASAFYARALLEDK